MAAVGADGIVAGLGGVQGADGDGLLAELQVRAAAHVLVGVQVVADLLLKEPDPQHVLVEVQKLFQGEPQHETSPPRQLTLYLLIPDRCMGHVA